MYFNCPKCEGPTRRLKADEYMCNNCGLNFNPTVKEAPEPKQHLEAHEGKAEDKPAPKKKIYPKRKK